MKTPLLGEPGHHRSYDVFPRSYTTVFEKLRRNVAQMDSSARAHVALIELCPMIVIPLA